MPSELMELNTSFQCRMGPQIRVMTKLQADYFRLPSNLIGQVVTSIFPSSVHERQVMTHKSIICLISYHFRVFIVNNCYI